MNCRTSQHELSQCLDGRLPSGRRAAVMEHAAGCQQCTAFWQELQQAQELILRLPRQRTGPEFREGLWQRIQSGEGTPPAVFQEPVPVATKIRYLATGAAAAALLLVAWRFATRDGGTPEQTPLTHLPRVANEGAGVAPAPGRLQPRPQPVDPVGTVPTGLLAAIEPLTPNLMAREAALQFNTHLTSANDYARQLQPRGQEPVTDPDHNARRLCEQAGEMTRLGRVLLDLQAYQHVSFSEPVADELKLVVDQLDERTLARHEPAAAAGSIVMVLPRLRHVGRLAEEIRGKLSYSCQELDVFQMRLAKHPEVLQLLFASGMELGPVERFSLSIRQGDCGPNAVLVAPRSRLSILSIQLMPKPK